MNLGSLDWVSLPGVHTPPPSQILCFVSASRSEPGEPAAPVDIRFVSARIFHGDVSPDRFMVGVGSVP